MNRDRTLEGAGLPAFEAVPTPPPPTPESHADVRRAARALASAALAARHGKTAEHSDEVVELCQVIAGELRLGTHASEQLLLAAQLHDVGKIAIPQEILDKPGALDAREWELMRQHTIAGQHILSSVPEMADVALIVRHAHERWDGDGYPDGIAGDRIPLASRVIFCVDAFHVIRSDRPYRTARTLGAALAEIRANSGTQFDPRVATALLRVADDVAHGRGGRHRLSRRALPLLMMLVIGGTASAAIPAVRDALGSVIGISKAHVALPAPGGVLHRVVPRRPIAPIPTRAPAVRVPAGRVPAGRVPAVRGVPAVRVPAVQRRTRRHSDRRYHHLGRGHPQHTSDRGHRRYPTGRALGRGSGHAHGSGHGHGPGQGHHG